MLRTIDKYLFTPILIIISIPLGIIIGVIGQTIGIIQDMILSIKRINLEHRKYPEWVTEKYREYFQQKHPGADVFGLKAPGVFISSVASILSNLVLYPILLAGSIFKGPKKFYKQMRNPADKKYKLKRSRKKIILLFSHDESAVQQFRQLTGETYQIICPTEPQEAYEFVRTNLRWLGYVRGRIDLILTDIDRSDGADLELIRLIKTLTYYSTEIPIIMITTQYNAKKMKAMTEGKRSPVVFCLTKPFKPDTMPDIIRLVLKGDFNFLKDKMMKAIG